jgi:hypothetical protein
MHPAPALRPTHTTVTYALETDKKQCHVCVNVFGFVEVYTSPAMSPVCFRLASQEGLARNLCSGTRRRKRHVRKDVACHQTYVARNRVSFNHIARR